jgi:uncharacterized protein (UPF0335 family)
MAKFFSVLFDVVGSFLLCVVLVVVFFNPVSFLIWSFVAPRRAAAIVSDTQDDGKFIQFMAKLHKPLIHLYPMRIKKYFMLAFGLYNYSIKSQIKAFKAFGGQYCMTKAVRLIKKMKREAVVKLWEENMAKPIDPNGGYNKMLTDAVVEAGVVLDDNQLIALIYDKGDFDNLEKYAAKKTLSKETLEAIMDRMERAKESSINKEDELCAFTVLKEILFNQIEKNGLPAKLMERVMSLGKGDGSYLQKLDCAIETFRQKTVVLSGNKEAFVKLLESRTLFSTVEKLLKPEQYEKYKDYGRHMADDAICEFIARENMEMCSLIFERERLSEKARFMAKANPKFALMLTC